MNASHHPLPTPHAQCPSKRMSMTAPNAAMAPVCTLGCSFRRKAFFGGV